MLNNVRGRNFSSDRFFVLHFSLQICWFPLLARGGGVSRDRLDDACKPSTYLPQHCGRFFCDLWCLVGCVWAILDVPFFLRGRLIFFKSQCWKKISSRAIFWNPDSRPRLKNIESDSRLLNDSYSYEPTLKGLKNSSMLPGCTLQTSSNGAKSCTRSAQVMSICDAVLE